MGGRDEELIALHGRSGVFLFCVMGAMFVLSLKADAGIKKYIKMQGEEESVKIKAQTDKDKTILLADSYMEAEKTKGEGDAGALKIYTQAYEKDPEFYAFVRTLEAYGNSLGEGTNLVLPGDSEFFKYLNPPIKE
jgi:HflC protein